MAKKPTNPAATHAANQRAKIAHAQAVARRDMVQSAVAMKRGEGKPTAHLSGVVAACHSEVKKTAAALPGSKKS